MIISHEDYVVAGAKLYQRSNGGTIATFSSLAAATHIANMWREGNLVSAKWPSNGSTTAGDRATFDALPKS